MTKRICATFFDTETNGFQGSSVLSFSAIKLEFWIENGKLKCNKVGELNEYFIPLENWNDGASKIHGITEDNIDEYRLNNRVFKVGKYSEDCKYFNDEFVQSSIEKLFHSSELVIAHNIKFDMSFMKFPFPKSKQFCTMESLKDIVAIPHPKYGIKTPKLMECAEYYGLKFDESQLHGSLYDTRVLTKVFQSALKDQNTGYLKMVVDLIKEKNKECQYV